MAKGKTFAEKAMKGTKPKDEFEVYKVITTRMTPKGTLRFETRVVKVGKGDNEKELLGL